MAGRLFLVALLSAGCNQFYGLDDTELAGEGDTDGDGVLDSKDNCVTVPNPGQEDVDGDDKGDACALVCLAGERTNKDLDRDRVDDGCDPCPRAPQQDAQGRVLDEDGDGAYDACDNCPGTPNADQANADLDELGDACEVGPTPRARLLFDPLWRRQTFWATSWTIGDGTARPDQSVEGMRLRGAELVFGGNTQSWYAEVAFLLPASAPAGQFGVDVSAGECLLERTATGLDLIARNPTLSTAPVAVATTSGLIRLRAYFMESGPAAFLRCEANGASSSASIGGDYSSVQFRITSTLPVDLTYVDLAN